jgi:hypothetical protein
VDDEFLESCARRCARLAATQGGQTVRED